MSDYKHNTDRTDWTYLAECPNNGDCDPIADLEDAPDDPDNCEHLTLEAEATNAELSPEEVFPIDECPVCGAELDFIKHEEPSEVLE